MALAGGARALGHRNWGLEPGAPAHIVVLDDEDPRLVGHASSTFLDALVFATDRWPVRVVLVGGQERVKDGAHVGRGAIRRRFGEVVRAIAARV
jgi:formimidoylglutamate deiminase